MIQLAELIFKIFSYSLSHDGWLILPPITHYLISIREVGLLATEIAKSNESSQLA